MGLDIGLHDIQKIKAILRQNGLHESWCASRTSADGRTGGFPPCNCYVSEDPFDMEARPPMRIETSSNIAETGRMHLYADGTKRHWRRHNKSHGGSGEWEETTHEQP